jgi:DNA polymerase
MKTSPITGKQTYAFAKNDRKFVELLEHEDIEVQALMAARLGVKSTIEETRAQRYWNIALATQNTFMQPLFPCPLKYSGAHTHRFSGDWKLNVQNLGSRKGTRLRECLEAPMDHVILAVDASQIEARLVAWIAQQESLLELFANREDVYSAFASKIHKRPITKRDNPIERFNGKTCVLGLGFGMGEAKLYDKLTFDAKEAGYDVEYNRADVGDYVRTYRTEYSNIKRLWYWCDGILWDMVNGDTLKSGYDKRIGPCRIEGTTVILPSGLKLYYEGLVREQDEFWFTYGGRRKKIYGGKMTENVVQALDRQHTLEAAVRTELRAKSEGIDGRITHQVHDENLYVILRAQWRRLAQIAMEEMRRPCEWATPESSGMSIALPLDAEVKVGENYGNLREIKM